MESAGSHARYVTTSILVYRTRRVNEKRHVTTSILVFRTQRDSLLPIKNGYIMEGGGHQFHGVGINFFHPEVVKLQQQSHMQNTIFDLHPPPPPPTPPLLYFLPVTTQTGSG